MKHSAGILAGCLCLTLSTVAYAQQNKIIEYKVIKGDTCTGIAKKVYGSGKFCYKMISKYNKMNKKFKIIPGQILKLPSREEIVAPKKPDAILTQRKGEVEARAPKASNWSKASKGKALYTLWRVNSGKKSSAEVSFTKAQGRIQMRENTLVIIYGSNKEKAKRVASRAVLERGTLRSRLGELSGKSSSMVVETPASTTTVGKGETLIAVEASGTTRVANFTSDKVSIEGKPKKKKRRRKRKRKIVKLPKNMGSKIEPGKEPTPPKPLPNAPTWRTKGPVYTIAIDDKSKQTIKWQAVAGAKFYRVEVLDDAKGTQILDRFKVPAKITDIVLQDLPPQTYYARISTIDDDAFEGQPSKVIKLVIMKGQFKQSDKLTKSSTKQVFVGSSFSLPDVRCKTSEKDTLVDKLILTNPGPNTLYCMSKDNKTIAPIEIDVQPVRVEGLTQKLTFTQNKTTSLTFSTQPPVEAITVKVPEGVEVKKKNLGNGQWRVDLTPSKPIEKNKVALYLGDSTDSPVLSALPIEVAQLTAKPTPKVLPPPYKEPFLTIGIYGRFNGLYESAYKVDGQTADKGFRAGLNVNYIATQRLSIGGYYEYGGTTLEARSRGVNSMGFGLHGLFHILKGNIRPYVKLGAGMDLFMFNDGYNNTTKEVLNDQRDIEFLIPAMAGGGLKVRLGDRSELDLSIQQHLVPWQDVDLTYYTSGSIGLSVNF